MTTAAANYFSDDKISGTNKYKAYDSTPTTQNGVTLSGAQSKGVKTADSGKSLVYAAGPTDVANVSLGAVDFEKGATLFDGSAASYNYANAAVNADSFSVSFATPETVAAGDNMTLLAANATLADMAAQSAKDVSYSVTPVTGVTLNAMINGSVGRSGNNIAYTATANKAAKLTFGDVLWLDTGALLARPVNIDFNGAAVDTTKINFTNKDYLATDSKMTLVSDFGTAVGTITGTAFTVGKGTGEGHAYFESGSLRYLVTKGVTEPEPEPTPESDISGQTETVKPGETVTDNVVAAEATGNETATSNTATVSDGGTVGTAVKPANVTGATTESGAAAGNMATVTDGGVIVGSDPEEKPALVGAITESGKAEGNKANVTGGTVTGNVTGAVSGTGVVSSNTATVSGKSEVTGTVVGASAKTGKLADGNSAEVYGQSTVTGNVAGAEAAKGEVSNNSASISEKSIVKGDVIGAVTESGAAVANAVTVTGDSQIKKNDPESGEAKDKEVAGGDVIGAMTESGTASQNTVTVTESIVERDVSGANSTSGEVNTNTVTISGGEIGGSVFGGRTEGTKGAVSNGVVLEEGAEVKGDVYGGMSEGGAVDRNTVEISGEETAVTGNVFGASSKTASTGNSVTMKDVTVGGYVFGAVSKAATMNNTVTMTGGAVNGLVGGGCETATENYVSGEDGFVAQFAVGGLASKTATGNTVTMTGGSVYNGIYGGYGETVAENDNHVYLGGGTVSGISPYDPVAVDGFTLKEGGVYGGYSVSGTTQHNCVILYGTADVSTANLFGGNREATGNTLHIGYVLEDGTKSAWTGGGQSVGSVNNFETIQFDVVQWSEETPALTVGAASDLSATTIDAAKVHFTGTDALAGKDEMTLLDQNVAASKAAEDNLNKESAFTAGTALQGKGTLSLDDKGNVKYTIDSVTSSDQSHNAVMGATVSMAALSVGNDFIGSATEGLSLTSNTGADGVSSFAKLGGGSMRQETGSHVDTHTWNAIHALGHQNKKERGTMEYGAFFEYGTGNYTTHNGDERGDGSAKYTGGVVLAKWTAKHGFYVEGSLRAGTIHDDARNVLRDEATHMPYSYETDAGYFGAHIGVGKEIALANGNVVDVYGKYFYNRRNGVSFDAGGDHYDLDAVTSQIVRIGARYTVKRDKWNYYAGAAYEHELDGKAAGTANTFAIRSADTSGASFRGEIGATMKPGENSPWSLDLNVAGFAGKKQGVTGGVSVSFMF